MALRRGAPGLRADPGPAAPGGARQLLRLDEAGAGERDATARHAGGQGHGRRPVRAGRRAQPRRGHRRAVPRLHGQARAVLPRRPAVGRGADRLARPPGRRAGTHDGRPLRRAAGRAAGPDGPGDVATWGWRARWPTCSDALRQARPDLPWGQRGQVPDGEQAPRAWATRPPPSPSSPTSRRCPASCPRATPAPRWPTSTRSCSSGRWAAPPSTTSPRCARWSASSSGRATSTAPTASCELSPKAVRRLGATALRRVFAKLDATGRGEHDVADAGAAGELTGSSREWRFGDEQPLDVVRTVKNAVLRTAARAPGRGRAARCGSPSTTSRWSRPSGAPAPRSRCWSTSPTRWRCAARGARPSRRRWRCTRW